MTAACVVESNVCGSPTAIRISRYTQRRRRRHVRQAHFDADVGLVLHDLRATTTIAY